MKTLLVLWFGFALAMAAAQGIDPALAVEERTAGGDAMKRYFLIHHRVESSAAPKEYALLLMLPGGPGNAEFLPFCANVLTLAGVPKDFLVAQLVAPVWDKAEAMNNVWPSAVFPSKHAKFTTEEFVDAVIDEVGARHAVRKGWVFTCGWSSSGHVLYASSLANPKIRGSFIAMSRFYMQLIPQLSQAKGKRYYLWHSPDDAICPFTEAQWATKLLTENGAAAVLGSYKGGHGWRPHTFYADRLREALEWFRASDAEAEKLREKMLARAAP